MIFVSYVGRDGRLRSYHGTPMGFLRMLQRQAGTCDRILSLTENPRLNPLTSEPLPIEEK